MSDFILQARRLPYEQEAIRAKCFHPTGAFVEFKKEEIEQSIPRRFEQIVRFHPNRLAVKGSGEELTFGQLNDAANRIAHTILRERGEKSEPIALLCEQGVSAIVSILGLLKAGKFYVPLDPSLPITRMREILGDSGAALIITNSRNLPAAEKLSAHGYRLINIETVEPGGATGNPGLSITSESLAYIVYTSGSTGQPKGVAQSHRYVLYHVFEFGGAFHICPEDRISLIFPWSFSGGAHIIYSTLLHGAALFPFDIKAAGLGDLTQWLIEHEITIYHSTAAVLRQVLSFLSPDQRLPHLRLVRLGGEAAAIADLSRYYKDNFSPNCLMLNSLATTECGIICRYFFDKDTPVAR